MELPTLILVLRELKSAALLVEKRTQAAEGKVVVMPGRYICEDKPTRLITPASFPWPRALNLKFDVLTNHSKPFIKENSSVY